MAEKNDDGWSVGHINVAGVFASAIFLAAGLIISLLALWKRRGTGSIEDPLLNAEYSLIKEESSVIA